MEDYIKITEQAKERMDQIQKQMKILEIGQIVKAQMGQPSLTLLFRDRGEDIPLEGFLYPEQMEGLKQTAASQVEARMGDAAASLRQMIHGETEPDKQSAAVIPSAPRARKCIDKAEVRRLYLEEGKTAKEVAEITGFTYSGIMTYLSRHGLSRRPAKRPEQEGFRGDDKAGDDEDGVPALDDGQERLDGCEEQIRKNYETGVPLKRLAEEYGVSKRVMYDFIRKNHMRRSVN